MEIGKVKSFANEQGYNDVLYLGKWNGYDAYEPVVGGDVVSVIGPPLIILAKDNVVRMSTVEESYKQLDDDNVVF